jgi:hypothetical protein
MKIISINRRQGVLKPRKYSVGEYFEETKGGAPFSFPESELPKRRAQLRVMDLLFEQKAIYGSWEGTPTALVRRDGDDMLYVEGFTWSTAEQKWMPGFTEEAYSKAEVVSDAEFHKLFPGVPSLPPLKNPSEEN